MKQILTFYGNSNSVFFPSFLISAKKRELDFINFHFCFFYFDLFPAFPAWFSVFPLRIPAFPTWSPYSHPDSPHSHPDSPHSHPDSPHSYSDSQPSHQSHPNSPYFYPDSPHSHHSLHSVPRFPILAFTDSP